MKYTYLRFIALLTISSAASCVGDWSVEGTATASGTGGATCGPSTVETCNGVDDDCDGQIDNGDPAGGTICQTGLDGRCATGVEHCVQGVVSCIPDHRPGDLPEACNDLDDDCDGL